MTKPFYRQLQQLLDEGLSVAVATIVQVKGSTPREVGAKMIIHPYGRHVGTVGGVCGGILDVLIERWAPEATEIQNDSAPVKP